MSDPLTPNKGLDLPATGEYNNAWGPVLNQNFTDIDTAIAGFTSISVTGVPSGSYQLSLAQYLPMNVQFTGTLSGNIVYVLPAGVTGLWCISNNTTGAFSLSWGVSGGNNFAIPQGQNSLIISNGSAVGVAQTSLSSANPSAQVGLAPINGTASTYMTSDSAPELDQNIAPKWDNNHQFNAAASFFGLMECHDSLVVESGATLDGTAGTVLVPTQTTGNNTTMSASTAFVLAQIAAILGASPGLGGAPTAPTAAASTNNTQIATTAFAVGPGQNLAGNGWKEFPGGFIIQWGISSFSSGGSSIAFSAVTGKAFPNNAFMAIANAYGSAATAYVQSVTTTTLSAVNGISGTNSWIAFGN